MSIFSFLQNEWNEIYEAARSAEKSAVSDTRICAFYCRYTLEKITKWLYDHDDYLKKPYNDSLGSLIHEQTFKDNLSPGLFQRIRFIWELGNKAVHTDSKVKPERAIHALKSLHAFTEWFASYYSENPPSKIPEFTTDYIVEIDETEKTKAEVVKLSEELKKKDEQLAKEREKLTEELEALRAKVTETKEKNIADQPKRDYTEAETRKIYIDMMLEEAGWDLEPSNVKEFPVVGMPSDSGDGYVDYVLWGDDGKPLAVVEAKRTTVNPKEGQHQAKLYADCLEKMTGQRPVIFYSNGYETFLWDDLEYPPREVFGFYNKDELQLIINRRSTRGNIGRVDVNKAITGRPYQEIAIKKVCEAFQGKNRETLLVMATGTGKTRVAVSLVDALMKNNWVKRVLFLADRVALVKQAKNAFTEHAPSYSTVNLLNEKEDINTRIVFSTYPTMMNMIDDRKDDGEKRFGSGHFDLIIVDEAHRSIYLKYKEIFRYFDSLLLGLTATPKNEVDRNTYSLFGIENGIPTYAYELDEAVKDGYLVPPKLISSQLRFQRHGIKYNELSEDEKDEYEAKFYDEFGNVPDEIDASALNSWLFNTDTVDKVLGQLMEFGRTVEGGDKLGKTIVFAKNHKHALFIVDRFDKNFPQYRGEFASLIDYSVNYADDLIDKFKVIDSNPVIAVSVDMLDTGIDVPEVVNLVFFKPVRSKAKFWQMIGRGTRLCEDLYAPGEDKEDFLIFDYCDNFEFFDKHPEGFQPSVQESLSSKLFKNRLYLVGNLIENENDALCDSLLDILHERVSALDTDTVLVRPHRKHVEKYIDRDKWNSITFDDINELVDNIALLVNEPDEDEYAKRFDSLIVNLQLVMVDVTRGSVTTKRNIQNTIIKIADSLKKKTSIPKVKQRIEILKLVTDPNFWKDASIYDIEKVRTELRGIVQFLDRNEKEVVYTKFKDEIVNVEVRNDIIASEPALAEYRKRIEKYIREHQNNTAIYKIKNNIPITLSELHTLEGILFEGDLGTKDDFVQAYGNDKPLSMFVRELVGLEGKAVEEAFSAFLDISSLSADQIKFVEGIKRYFTDKGVMNPNDLFNPPFTHIHSEGIFGLFDDTKAGKIINTIKELNSADTVG